tara:strand:+ start:8649 stop:8933 length:285 start_codon:yes stop_codon:yes gene_type:complete
MHISTEQITRIFNILKYNLRIHPEIASEEATGTGANLEVITEFTKTTNIDQVDISEKAKKRYKEDVYRVNPIKFIQACTYDWRGRIRKYKEPSE